MKRTSALSPATIARACTEKININKIKHKIKMKILLSPAKSLNYEAAMSSVIAAAAKASSRPATFAAQTEKLLASISKLSKPQLKALFSVSDAIASLNHGRFASFSTQPERPCLGAFEGQAYKGLDAATLTSAQLEYLTGSLRILCGLYGVLRPLDQIRPYRLEMSTRYAHGAHGARVRVLVS